MCHGASRTSVALLMPNSSLDADSKEMGMASMVSGIMPPAQPERLTPEVRSYHTSAFHIEVPRLPIARLWPRFGV